MTSLVEHLGIGRDLVAFVGGGGKSTLTLAIGRELADAGRPVVVTTTTKMGADQIPQWATVCRDADEVAAALQARSPVFLLRSIEGPKVIGADPGLVSRIFTHHDVTIVAEADGARRRPFKAPGPDEPVIPENASLVVVVAGADALYRRIAEACHRPEQVAALIGRGIDGALGPQDLVTVVGAATGGRKNVPSEARLILALTKVGVEHRAAVDEIERALPSDIQLVVVGAR
jgi:probable selenium-dependent hydroxylase accessory protein YqeC